MQQNILIVDDDRDIVTVLTVILEEEGFAVHKAYTGKEALKKTLQEKPDLILLDYMLPDMNGDEVAAVLRKKQVNHTIPIILISAAHNAKKIAVSAKLHDYIAKPFEIEDLLSTLRKWLPS